MKKWLFIVPAVTAGLGACLFGAFCNSLNACIGLIVCLFLWWLFRVLTPMQRIYRSSFLRYYQGFIVFLCAAFGVAREMVPHDQRYLLNQILAPLMFILILAYAHKDYREA